MKPEIFLVTGDRTDAGKTTITCALIRKFRREGVKAIGFKPFGSNVLFDDLDFLMSRFPSGKAALYGGDALRIAEASGHADEAMIELIAPVHFLGFTRHVDTLLVRAGSEKLDNRLCFSTELFDEPTQRRDLLSLFDRLFPWHPSARTGEKQRIGMLDRQLAEKCQAAYDHLCAENPEIIIIEGAGPLLPAWNSDATGNLIYLSGARVDLYTDVTVNVSNGRGLLSRNRGGQPFAVPRTNRLLSRIANSSVRRCSIDMPLVAGTDREKNADNLAGRIIEFARS